jgi:hypothetical protein
MLSSPVHVVPGVKTMSVPMGIVFVAADTAVRSEKGLVRSPSGPFVGADPGLQLTKIADAPVSAYALTCVKAALSVAPNTRPAPIRRETFTIIL